MKTKIVSSEYYACDYCKHEFGEKSACAFHERRCFANPLIVKEALKYVGKCYHDPDNGDIYIVTGVMDSGLTYIRIYKYDYEGEKFIGVQQDHTSSSNALFMIQHQEITKEEAKEIFNKYIDEMKVFE